MRLPPPPKYFRRVIRIKATDSPNVAYALEKIRRGLPPGDEIVVPGVLTYAEYAHRRATWDKVRQSVGLDAEFYEGTEILLYPPDWLNEAEERARKLPAMRKALAGGCDPAEGGDSTTMAAVDEYGLIDLEEAKTPDTSVIAGRAIAFIDRHGIPPERFAFDRGGGGKQVADLLRSRGYPVMSVGFGETLTPELRRGRHPLKDRRDNREERYEYVNRRAQMYGLLSEALDPSLAEQGPRFAIPERFQELRRQMAPIPKLFDGEGRMRMLPKSKKNPDSKERTLIELIGRSPDDLDAVVLAVFARSPASFGRNRNAQAGAY